jgi:hypothetical protein
MQITFRTYIFSTNLIYKVATLVKNVDDTYTVTTYTVGSGFALSQESQSSGDSSDANTALSNFVVDALTAYDEDILLTVDSNDHGYQVFEGYMSYNSYNSDPTNYIQGFITSIQTIFG